MNNREKRFLLLQVNDALFPIGAYSHSYGLETYIQKNLVSNALQAKEFIFSRLVNGFCYSEFLTVKLAYEYATKKDVSKLEELEEILEASRMPREIREAEKKLGSRFIKTVKALSIQYESDIFIEYVSARTGKSAIYGCVYGVFCAATGIELEDCLEHYLYAQTSSMVTNCVKTIPLSQTDGQVLLYECQQVFEIILEKLKDLTEDDLCLSAPGFDIRCMQHEGLYSRIYMS
jgi:urease accessory protein